MVNKSEVVVIGGVAAGPKAAATLARRKPELKITLFQKEKDISYSTCGLPYFASGDVNSFEELTLTSYGVVRDTDFFRKTKGFEVITRAEVASVNRNRKTITYKLLDTDETLEHGYDRLVMATGAVPNAPAFPVVDSPKIIHFTRPEDAFRFRENVQRGQIGRAVIIGGGFIGCEVAEATGTMWGVETTLIEKEEQLLPYVLDPEMAAIAERELVRQDVTVHTGTTVEKIEENADGELVVTLVGNESVTTDFVFLCLGVHPNVELARDCGLAVGETGAIRVDEHLRTSDPDIYAGGDCIQSRSLVTGKPLYIPMGSLANRHGRIIAENIAGQEAVFQGVTGAFLVKVYDVNVGSAGITQRTAEGMGIASHSVWASFVDKPDYYPESRNLSLKMTYAVDDGRLLGLQAVGAGDICRRIDVFSVHLKAGAKVADLLDFEHGYAPPYSEALDPLHHLAALAIAREKGLNIVSPAVSMGGNSIWLDVREPEEVSGNPWPLSDDERKKKYISIPLNDLRDNLDKLDPGKKIILICRRGPRSYQASLILKQAGFSNVHVIGGGTTAALS